MGIKCVSEEVCVRLAHLQTFLSVNHMLNHKNSKFTLCEYTATGNEFQLERTHEKCLIPFPCRE